MRIVGNNPQLSRQTQATASGAITGGKPIVVNTDGTVSGVTGETFSTTNLGSGDSFIRTAMTFDSNSNRIVIAYGDGANSQYGTAVVASVSGGNISFGTPVVFNSAKTGSNVNGITITFDSNSNKVVIAYRDNGNSNYGTAIVGTVDNSDNSISFGSEAVFESALAYHLSSTFDTNSNKVVVSYRGANDDGFGVVGTVSGTSISFGTATEFSGNNDVTNTAATFDSSNNKVVIAYTDAGNSNIGTAVVGTVSGTSISFGSVATFSGSNDATFNGITFDTNSNKVVIAYRDESASNVGKAIVGTVSSTSISFGTAVTFRNADSTHMLNSVVFDSSNNKIVIAYYQADHAEVVLGTVSGTSISFATHADTGTGDRNSAAYDTTNNKVVIAGRKDALAKVVVRSPAVTLTSENFIGFAEDTVATGQPVTINTKGAIADNMPQLESASSSLGSEAVYASVTARYPNAVFDSSNNRVVIGYTDGSNSNYGTAVVGSVSGTSISFGTPVVFESASIGAVFYAPDLAFDSNSNKIVIAYPDGGNSNLPTAIVGTVDPSDNSISFGTAATLQGSGAANTDMSIDFDSNSNKVLIVYRDGGNSNYQTGIVGTVSGTDITFGTKAVVVSSTGGYNSVAFDSNSNKFAVFYIDTSNGHGKCKVATISGTDVTYGSEATYASASSKYPQSTFDNSNNKIVVAFEDDDNSDYATAVVGTISGTDITFGTEAVINQGNIQNIFNHSITFATGINKIIHFTRDGVDGDHGKVHIGTVSGTGISFGSTILVNGGDALLGVTATFDSNSNKAVLAFMDEGNSNYGTAVVLTPAGTLEDLTPAQTYFVQTDGTLSETADSPSVTAGTAVAGSTLIVKG